MSRSRVARLSVHAAGLLMLCGSLWTIFHHRRWGLDDAYISYRYAQNLLAGHGLVFNPGEAVEGYTNFLYVLLMTPGIALFGLDHAYGWSVALNCLLGVGAVYAVHAAVAERLRARAWIPCMLLAASPGMWVACWSGLETSLVVALFAVAWAALTRVQAALEDRRMQPARVLALALVGLVLARADGFVMAAIFVGYIALSSLRGPLLLCAGSAAGATLLQVAWRLGYYGYPLPNSYYAKVSGDVVERVAFAWKTLPGLAPVVPYLVVIGLCGAAAWAAAMRAPRDPHTARAARWIPPFEVGFPVAWLGYWLYVGGDVFGARFLLVLIPLGAYLLVDRCGRFASAAPGRLAAVVVLLLLVALPWRGARLVSERTVEDRWAILGNYLGTHHPGAVLAADAAGKVPFFSGLVTIDMYGLNDARIAHEPSTFSAPGHSKSNPEYVLARRPELIAGWLDPTTLMVNPGIGRDAYKRAGYRLELLFYTPKGGHPRDQGPDLIVPARGMTTRKVRDYWTRGYRYGVLALSRQ